MSRKRNPYIPLFTHDIMSSAKCRRLSMRATGLYLWLLCLMNEKPQQGRWALSTNEDHPTWKNSLTYRALQNADKYARLPMFATLMARQFLPWKSGQVLKALQELYRFKLIVVEDDAIIQPRMYNDNGFKLREDTMREYLADDPNDTDDDPEIDLAGSYREALKKGGKKGVNKGTDKGTKKDPEKVHGIHARAQLNIESESENNINNSKGNIGGAGGNAQSDPTFWEFWDAYDYKTGNRSAAADQWALLSESERSIVMAAIPNYCDAHPVKKYRKTPCDFLRERIWEKTEEKTPGEQGEGQKNGFKGKKNPEAGNLSSDGQKRATKPEKGKNGHSEDDSQTAIYNKRNTQGHVTIDGKPVDTSDDEDDTVPTFEDFWALYDKQVNMMEAEAYWGVLSRQDKEAIMEYVPRYKIAQPRKQFRKNPANFLRMSAWKDELIIDTRIDNNNNGRQQATTTDRRGGYAGAARTQEQDAADGREQTMRIVNRIFADQDADHQAADGTGRGTDADGNPF